MSQQKIPNAYSLISICEDKCKFLLYYRKSNLKYQKQTYSKKGTQAEIKQIHQQEGTALIVEETLGRPKE